MTLPVVLFAVLAAVVAVSALGVVLSRDVVRAAVWLLFTLIGVSLLYFLLGAEFVGAAQLIVYVGGTLVLVVFGVMLTAQGPLAGFRPRPTEWVVGGLTAAALFAALVTVSLDLGRRVPATPDPLPLPSAGPIGVAFLGATDAQPAGLVAGLPEGAPATQRTAVGYLLPFEVVSVHLLVVLIGAAYLARAKRRPTAREAERP